MNKLFHLGRTALVGMCLAATCTSQSAQADFTFNRIYAACFVLDGDTNLYHYTEIASLPIKPVTVGETYILSPAYYEYQASILADFRAYLTGRGIDTYQSNCMNLETLEKLQDWKKSNDEMQIGHFGYNPVLITDWLPKIGN